MCVSFTQITSFFIHSTLLYCRIHVSCSMIMYFFDYFVYLHRKRFLLDLLHKKMYNFLIWTTHIHFNILRDFFVVFKPFKMNFVFVFPSDFFLIPSTTKMSIYLLISSFNLFVNEFYCSMQFDLNEFSSKHHTFVINCSKQLHWVIYFLNYATCL